MEKESYLMIIFLRASIVKEAPFQYAEIALGFLEGHP